MLEHFNMLNCTPVSTPLDPSIALSKFMAPTSPEDIAYMKKVPYSAVGSLVYLASGTRPDISHVVSVVSRFNSLECSIGRLSSAFSGTLKAP
jgi:hypothetical protein